MSFWILLEYVAYEETPSCFFLATLFLTFFPFLPRFPLVCGLKVFFFRSTNHESPFCGLNGIGYLHILSVCLSSFRENLYLRIFMYVAY